MKFPYLKEGFKLFLLTGGRREEIVDLKWVDIYQSENGTYFFMISKKKWIETLIIKEVTRNIIY